MHQNTSKASSQPKGLNQEEESRRFLLSIKEFSFESQVTALTRYIAEQREDVVAKLSQQFPFLGIVKRDI